MKEQFTTLIVFIPVLNEALLPDTIWSLQFWKITKKNENKNTTVPVIKSKRQDQLAAQGRAAANKTVLLKSL